MASNMRVGINHEAYDLALDLIATAASLTTNCLAPVVKVVHENFGIRHGQITSIHDPTNTNLVADAPHKGLLDQWGGLLYALVGSELMLLICWMVRLSLPLARHDAA